MQAASLKRFGTSNHPAQSYSRNRALMGNLPGALRQGVLEDTTNQ